MTFKVGDDATIVYPVTDMADPPGNLDLPAEVSARRWLGETTTITAAWLGDPGPARDLEVPLGDLSAGLWVLNLVVDGGTDLELGRVVIS